MLVDTAYRGDGESHDVRMNTIADYVEWLQQGKSFSVTKLNHGFWERIAQLREMTGGTLSLAEISDPAKLDRKTGPPCFLETGFFDELTTMLRGLPDRDDSLFFSDSIDSWPGCRRLEGTPIMGVERTQAIMREFVPANAKVHEGTVWKIASMTGEIAQVFEAMRGRKVVLVGPPRVQQFGKFVGIDDFTSVPVHPKKARYDREATKEKLASMHRADTEMPTLYVFQCGSLAAWLILKLHGQMQNAVLLDIGNAVNHCVIDRLLVQNWSQTFRCEVSRTVERVHPGWYRLPEAYEKPTTPEERELLWLELTQGLESRITGVTQATEGRTPPESVVLKVENSRHVEFVERKSPDWDRVRTLLGKSDEQNHWANGGPLSQLLEQALSSFFELPDGRSVVMCSSATTALNAVIGMHSYRAGKMLRWVTPSFGFFSTGIGSLTDSQFVDCDSQGLLDLEALMALDPSSFDGVVVTNTFGQHPDWQPFVDFCNDRGKVLVYDSAMALSGPARAGAGAPDEIVSFHHTKPWGFGEGGCAIVASEDVDVVRAHLNFGVGLEQRARPFSSNGKVSDLACAFILERMERHATWAHHYRSQRHRVLAMCSDMGLELLGKRPVRKNPMGSLPMLWKKPVDVEPMRTERFTMRKYYRPLSESTPVASDIYARIVNVPCHPDMSSLSSDEINGVLRRVLGL